MPADLFMCERRPVRKMRENIISAPLKNLLLLLLFGCSLSRARAFIYKSNELSSSLVGKKCFIILNPTHKYTHMRALFIAQIKMGKRKHFSKALVLQQ
jgi:hypothetical protein